jgi:hypothetical protein
VTIDVSAVEAIDVRDLGRARASFRDDARPLVLKQNAAPLLGLAE